MRKIKLFVGLIFDFIKFIISIVPIYFKTEKLDSLQNISDYELFITHNNAGGTLLFEENFLRNKEKIIIVKNLTWINRITLFYILKFSNDNKVYRISSNSIHKLLNIEFPIIYVNSLVTYSYKSIPLIQQSLLQSKSKLVYFVHDYHCICKNYNLVFNDFYCNLDCSSNNCRDDYESWRSDWEKFLTNVSNIICFSESSKKLITQIYPTVSEKVEVKPHDASYVTFSEIEGVDENDFSIAIVGSCSAPIKGSNVIKQLLIREWDNPFPFLLFGCSYEEFNIRKPNINYFGRYESNKLKELLEKNRVKYVLFPSICPETFSFTLSELMALGVYIISFDIGAQGDRIKNYNKGITVSSQEELIKLIDKLSYEREKII